LHFCFTAPTRESVNVFHAAALRSGGRDNGPPGIRVDYDLTTTLRSSSIRMGTGSKPGAGFSRLVCYERTPLQTGHAREVGPLPTRHPDHSGWDCRSRARPHFLACFTCLSRLASRGALVISRHWP
jgi:hypothetical protein